MRLAISFFLFIPVLLFSWAIFFKNVFVSVYQKWIELNAVNKLLLFFISLQFIFASRAWIEYKINLTGSVERISINSKSNLIFVIITLISIWIIYFYDSLNRKFIFLFSQFILIGFIIAGYIYPNQILTDFLKQTDYSRNYTFYLFCITLVLTTFFGFKKLSFK